MRKFLAAIFALLLAFSFCGCGTLSVDSEPSGAVSQNDDSAIYQVSDFIFNAPTDWTYEKAGDEFLFFDSGYVLYEWDGDLTEPNADDEFIANFLHLTQLSYEDFELTSDPTHVMFSGCNGFTFEFQYTADDTPAQGKAVVLFDEDGMLTFTLCDLDITSLHTAEFDALIASLVRK